MPSGRRLPSAFGIYTRLTGRACQGCCRRWTASASAALSWPSRTILPSTPAVKRPALSSVTRRTASSVFDRDRSVSFCRFRTRLWSCAWPDAVPGQRLPHQCGHVPVIPPDTSTARGSALRGINKVHAIHPSGLPLTRDPRDGTGTPRLPLGLRTPPLPAAHAKGRARQRARARDYTTDITSTVLTASPIAKCDIVSQRRIRMRGLRQSECRWCRLRVTVSACGSRVRSSGRACPSGERRRWRVAVH
jgi:hypothetical protein